MNGQERHVLERAVRILSEQATKAAALVDEAMAAGLGGSHPLTVHAKELRLELLKTKAAIERELGTLLLNCSKCGLDVYWIGAWRAAGVLGARGASSARRTRYLVGDVRWTTVLGRPTFQLVTAGRGSITT